jgi:hypothetical protein
VREAVVFLPSLDAVQIRARLRVPAFRVSRPGEIFSHPAYEYQEPAAALLCLSLSLHYIGTWIRNDTKRRMISSLVVRASDCQIANAPVATVLDSIPASVGTVESEGRQMKQC